MSQHTPGPWSINDWPQANTDIAIGAVGTPLIARIPLRHVSINEQKANARLIAAAPDLLAALLMVLDDPNALDGRPRTAEFVREAIAKAEGQP